MGNSTGKITFYPVSPDLRILTLVMNAVAVAVAENLSGGENEFAKLMTDKAHALGMSHTT